MLSDTIFTESEVSAENFAENIVVIAAVGALQEITIEVSISPLIPQRYITPKDKAGYKTSFKNIAKMHLTSLIPLIRLLLVRWKPIIIIGSGVLREAI